MITIDALSGYKLRKHIGKALQVRSSAIKTALEHYNVAARALSPPRHMLTLEEVVEYTFLSDFQLLQDTREDISQRPWASPTARLVLDTYFKMCRAQEEIIRLNVEICRFVTYLQDEDRYLCTCEEQLRTSHPTLAYQIRVLRNVRGRFNSSHLKRLVEITRLQGFTGTLEPGKSVNIDAGSPVGPITIAPPSFITTYPSLEVVLEEDCPDDLDEEQEEEEASVECTRTLEDVLSITT